ncbi:MAG: LysM peptidoglycan-binding domain-containing protein [Actinomycetota bacterium]
MKSMAIGIGLVAAASLTGLGLVACGGEAATTGATTVKIGATNYVTIPAAAATIPPVTTAPDAPGSQLQFEGTYIIVEGDYPSTVAAKWKVAFPTLMELNGWTLDENLNVPEWPGVGATIRIPAGAIVPGEPAPSTQTTLAGTQATTAPTAATVATTTTIASAETGCNGSYVIVEGDLPGRVAANFDVSLAALDAANVNTKGYKAFIVGVTIVIPKDC